MEFADLAHLAGIDADTWGHVAQVPTGWRVRLGAVRAESQLLKACAAQNIEFVTRQEFEQIELARAAQATRAEAVGGGEPSATGQNAGVSETVYVTVKHDALFYRIEERGWTGLAEGYIAGEWQTTDLPGFLTGLLKSGYAPRVKLPAAKAAPSSRGIALDLAELSSRQFGAITGGIFASGAATTLRKSRNVGRRERLMDVTTLSTPTVVEKGDGPAAQFRAVEQLLNDTGVRQGSEVLEFPATGTAVAAGTVARGALIDLLGENGALLGEIWERVQQRNAGDYVHVAELPQPIPQGDWRGRYDAIISLEQLEYLGAPKAFFQAIERLLAIRGRAGIQTVVAARTQTPAEKQILGVLRTYLWPHLTLMSTQELVDVIDSSTHLNVAAVRHFGEHWAETMSLHHQEFLAKQAQAAAAGFDSTFRRLWHYMFSVWAALAATGAIDAIQLILEPAPHAPAQGR